MHAALPASLDSAALARRLGELASHERQVQVDFLLHLDEYDRRRAWLEAGYGSLWDFCLRTLHLREGAAGRRIGAMRVLRRFPRLAGALREGRLCLSTVALLGPLLSDDNADDLVARAAFRTKAEVEHLVVSLQPAVASKEGLRKLPDRAANPPVLPPIPATSPAAVTAAPAETAAPRVESALVARPREPHLEMRPVATNTYSLRVTVDAGFKAELERLRALLSHKLPAGDMAAVLREAVRCAIEKHGKRRGAVEPRKKPAALPVDDGAHVNARGIPAEVRRQVWKRDGGRCTWLGPDGLRCASRWRLELDHIRPAALGGAATVDNLRVLCRLHNQLYAEQVYGPAHMEQFRRAPSRAGESAISSGSDRSP